MIKIEKRKKNLSSSFQYIKNKLLCYYLTFKSLGWLVGITFLLLGVWHSAQSFPLTNTIIAIFGSTSIAFSSAIINNISDKKLDIFSRKPTILIFKYISLKEMYFLTFLLYVIGLFLLLCINITVFFLGLIIVVLSVLYSIPPTRLKTVPPLDSIVNTLLLSTVPFFLGWALTEKPITRISLIYAVIFYIFMNSYVLIYTSIDIDTDKKFGIKTTCTQLGFTYSIALAISTFITSLILSLVIMGLNSPFTVSILICSPFFILIMFTKKIKFNNFLTWISIMLWVITMSLYLILKTHSIIVISILIIILSWFICNLIVVYKILPEKMQKI